ncbi:MAG: NADH-quinone oxidoreductase subunit H [bacterium]|nr:NADH-quinone oxidoreductase subunit H [bacterium]
MATGTFVAGGIRGALMGTVMALFFVVVVAPLVGLVLNGADRVVTARLQGRVGPPLLQPLYDLVKLWRKEPLVVNRVQIGYVYLHLAFMVMTLVLLALGGDMVLALFAHAFSALSLVIGASSVRSPFSRIGAQRKIMQMLAYEPVFILLVVGIYLRTGSFMASAVGRLDAPLIVSLPLVFLAYLVALEIKLEKSPFDVATSHHAHQELVKGVTLEYAGPYLALIEVAHFYETFLLLGIVAAFFVRQIWLGVGVALVVYAGAIVVDNVCARLRTTWMVRCLWTVPVMLAVCNIIWLYVRRTQGG